MRRVLAESIWLPAQIYASPSVDRCASRRESWIFELSPTGLRHNSSQSISLLLQHPPVQGALAMHTRSVLLRSAFASMAAVALTLALGSGVSPAEAQGQKVLKFIPQADLRILDPITTTAYITRNHGYMIYDTLFATDAKFQVQPQMVDKYELSSDKLTYTFTLRDGLKFHDGTPVRSADCIASID